MESLLEGGRAHYEVSTEAQVRAVLNQEVGRDRDLDQGEQQHRHNLTTSLANTATPREENQIKLSEKP